MTKTNALRLVFVEASTEHQFQNKWLTDEAWLQIMNDTIMHFIVTKELLNKALSGLHLTPPAKERFIFTLSLMKIVRNENIQSLASHGHTFTMMSVSHASGFVWNYLL